MLVQLRRKIGSSSLPFRNAQRLRSRAMTRALVGGQDAAPSWCEPRS
jgi:hypothetical protein